MFLQEMHKYAESNVALLAVSWELKRQKIDSAKQISLNFKCYVTNDHPVTVFVTLLKEDLLIIKPSVSR